MQSQNGDVQLSVTLDTSGIKSDVQKLKNEIQKNVDKKINTKDTAPAKVEVDTSNIKEATDEMEKLSKVKEELATGEISLETQAELDRIQEILDRKKQAQQVTQEEAQSEQEVAQNATTTRDIFREVAETQARVAREIEEIEAKSSGVASEQQQIAEDCSLAVREVERMKTALSDTDAVAEDMAYDLAMFEQGNKYSAEFIQLKNIAQDLTKEFTKGADELYRMEILDDRESVEFAQLAEKTAMTADSLREVNGMLADMRTSGEAYTKGINAEEVKRVEKAYDALTNKITLKREAEKQAAREAKESASQQEQANKQIAKTTSSAAKSGSKGVSMFSKLLMLLKKIQPHLHRTNKGFLGLRLNFGHILGALIGIRSIYALFSKLKSAITEGIKNLAQWNNGNNDTNKSISMLMSSLAQLKNALASAFAPILTIVAPALNYLIDLAIQAANAVAQFFATISGQTTWKRATKQQKDYADSLKKTGSAAKDTAGKLAAFDDLDVLGKKDEDSGGGAGGDDPNSMFEEVDIDPWFTDLWEKLKEMWENADFTELGALLGQKLKDMLDAIPWDYIQDVARKLGKSLATFLNGFINVEGLGYSIGRTLAEAWNTAIYFLESFIDEFDWKGFGDFLGDIINGVIEELDWRETALTIAKGLNGAFTTAESFLDKVEWGDLGEKVTSSIQTLFINLDFSKISSTWSSLAVAFFDLLAGAISGVDWESLPSHIYDAVKELIDGLDFEEVADSFSNFLYEAFKAGFSWALGMAELIQEIGTDIVNAINKGIEKVKQDIEDCGGNVIQGILKGITDALSDIWNWVKEHIFDPIINAFKDAFGIASPSTVMEEQGHFIMEGLFKGIDDMINDVVQLWEDLKTLILEKVTLLKTKLEETWRNIKTTATTIWTNIKTTVSETVEKLKSTVTEKVDALKTKLQTTWTTLKTNTLEKFAQMKQGIVNVFVAIKDAIKNPINGIIGFVESMVNFVVDGVNFLIDRINSLISLSDKLPSDIGIHIEPLAHLEQVSLPRLAQGAVIPPNREFLAMLGDQHYGTNIEAPLDTIRDAFEDVVGNMQVENTGYSVMELDGQTFARLIVPYVVSEMNRKGMNVKVLEAT